MKLIILILFIQSIVISKFQKKHQKKSQKKQLGIVPGTLVPKMSETSHSPNIGGINPPQPYNTTLNPEKGLNTGRHSISQMTSLFLNKYMTNGQIRSILNAIDSNNDGSFTDEEYDNFYAIFIAPFMKCDTDSNNQLNAAELLACFKSQPDFPFLQLLQPTDIAKIIFNADQATFLTFFDYMFLRRVNNALTHCSENYLVIPSNLYCALAITSPRTKKIYSPDERIMFKTAVILSDGYENGQNGFLTIPQFIGLAYIYNFFNDYQIPFDEGFVYKQDFLRASQDQMLPLSYTPNMVNQIFADFERLNFFSLGISLYSFRMFAASSIMVNNVMQFELSSFQGLCTNSFPDRLNFVISKSMVPSQAEIEAASVTFWNQQAVTEDNYLRNYNNLMFLQKKAKVSFMKKVRKNVILTYYSQAAAMTFQTGSGLIFQMINTYNNNSMKLGDFARYYRLSVLYLEYDPNGLQRITNEVIQKKEKPFVIQAMTKNDKFMFDQLQDLLQKRPDFYLNYKQFMSWFFVRDVFEYTRVQGTQFITPITQLIGGFQKLGMRLSKYAIKNSITTFDIQNNQRQINYKQTFIFAYFEELLAMRSRYVGLLNTATVP